MLAIFNIRNQDVITYICQVSHCRNDASPLKCILIKLSPFYADNQAFEWWLHPKWYNFVIVREEISCYLCYYSNGWEKVGIIWPKSQFIISHPWFDYILFCDMQLFNQYYVDFARTVCKVNWKTLKILNELNLRCHLSFFLLPNMKLNSYWYEKNWSTGILNCRASWF